MTVFYKYPNENKVFSGNYDKLKNDDNILYFDIKFFKTYSEAKNQKNAI